MEFPDDPYLDYKIVDEGIKYLTFEVEGQSFGIEVEKVLEIVGNQEIICIPELPIYSKGIINLRGRIIPIIDMRLRLKKNLSPCNEYLYIVVVELENLIIGFIVDKVEEIVNIEEENISPPPRVTIEYSEYFVSGIGEVDNKVITLLDVKKLLTDKEEVLIDELIDKYNCTII